MKRALAMARQRAAPSAAPAPDGAPPSSLLIVCLTTLCHSSDELTNFVAIQSSMHNAGTFLVSSQSSGLV